MSDENTAGNKWRDVSVSAREFSRYNKRTIWGVFIPCLFTFFILAFLKALPIFFPDTPLSSNIILALDIAGAIIFYYVVGVCMISSVRLIILGEASFLKASLFKPIRSDVLCAVQFCILVNGLVYIDRLLTILISPSLEGSLPLGFIVWAVFYILQMMILYRLSFYFVGLALNESISVVESIRKAKGHVLRMLMSVFIATFYVISFAVFYSAIICFAIVITIALGSTFITVFGVPMDSSIISFMAYGSGMFVSIRASIYIMPIIMALHVYVVCHYYMLVENKKMEQGIP